MSFLDEATIKTTPDKLAKVKAAADDDDTIEVMEKKGRDLDGDGDIDSDDYLAARDAAIKKAKAKIKEMAKNLGYSKDPETGKIISMSSNDAIQNWLNKIKQDLENEDNLDEDLGTKIGDVLFGKSYNRPFSDFMDNVKDLLKKDKTTLPKDNDKLISKIASIEKGELSKEEFLSLLPKLKKAGMTNKELGELKARYKAAKVKKDKVAKAKKEKMKEEKTVELPADTTFTLDLKHLMKKHMDEGKSQEDVVKLTKALMKKLHNKGEVKVDGTKVIFKEAFFRSKDNPFVPDSAAANSFEGARKKAKENGEDTFEYAGKVYKTSVKEASVMGVPLESFADYYTALELAKNVGVPVVAFSALLAIMGIKKATEFLKKGKEAVMNWYEQNKLNEQEDTQLALPEPDAPDFLGDDGVDYEGGMAKSQMLKMKKYAAALCDMIEDESQLEAWVQAKLTKASDYMSAVYHYLDYQKSKMNEGFELNGREVVDLEGEAAGEDSYITTAYYLDTDEKLTDDEIEDLVNKYPADLSPGGAWWEKQR